VTLHFMGHYAGNTDERITWHHPEPPLVLFHQFTNGENSSNTHKLTYLPFERKWLHSSPKDEVVESPMGMLISCPMFTRV
jgi:hypothetical protein